MDAEGLAFKALQELTAVKYVPNGYHANAVRLVAHNFRVTDEAIIDEAIEIVKEKLPILLNSLKTQVWNELK